MSFERLKMVGLVLLCIALTLAVRRTIASLSPGGPPDQRIQAISATAVSDAAAGDSIPVEIVEAGQVPRVQRVPISR